ncbi:MAG: FAD-dependent oxidoreductase [Vulcanimicrobiota bacterium]
MKKSSPVLIIGGGATGSSIARDCALRGIDCILLEQSDLATGTSGRFHGLLHSGARYAVKDPGSAKECITENRILRDIASPCITDTGGAFVARRDDDSSYIKEWLSACYAAGIPTEELSASELRKEAPLLTDAIQKAYSVPDASIDGFLLTAGNCRDASLSGALIKTYTRVTGFVTENNSIKAATVINKADGREERLDCSFVINAAGPWAGEISGMAGLDLPVSPDKGILIAFNHIFTKRVINRLRPSCDGDIFVPHHHVTILGTTSKPAKGPDDYGIDSREVLELLRTGKELVPSIEELRIIRAFAGVRPLYSPPGGEAGRSATRKFIMIDHESLGGVANMLSITGGKLTTCRLMAEQTVDALAGKLGVKEKCTTHKREISMPPPAQYKAGQALLCECERLDASMLDEAAKEKSHFSIGDIRRLTHLGMGPCQGTFCSFRAAGHFQESLGLSSGEAARLLREELQERWKGSRPVCWKWQASQSEMARRIYCGLLSLERTEG